MDENIVKREVREPEILYFTLVPTEEQARAEWAAYWKSVKEYEDAKRRSALLDSMGIRHEGK